MKKFNFWFLVYPDIPKPIGGVKQMHRAAEAISKLGHNAVIVQDNKSFHPGWFSSSVSTIAKNEWFSSHIPSPKVDIIVIAETFVPICLKIFPGVPKIIFNQNGSYTFGLSHEKPYDVNVISDIYNNPDVIHIWCVSDYDRRLLVSGLMVPSSKVSTLINSSDLLSVSTRTRKRKQVAFMPRKNSHDATVVTALLSRQPWFSDWNIQPIVNLKHSSVISTLQDSLIFLSFGHPEGFGLPVLEAMISGCFVVGYSGLGGRDLFSYKSQFPLMTEVSVGDWQGFLDSVFNIVCNFDKDSDELLYQLGLLSDSAQSSHSFEAFERSLFASIQSLQSLQS